MYGREVARMQEDIDEMLAHYHDNDVEVYTILSNTVTMHDHMKWALERNERALCKPYFGRIIFEDENLGKEESIRLIRWWWIGAHRWQMPIMRAGLGNAAMRRREMRRLRSILS